MAKKPITINEALSWQKALNTRHAELVQLRNENSYKETRYFGANAENKLREPIYAVKKLDALIGNIAKEIRLLDSAVKATNASAKVKGYEMDEDVLGVLE